ncbi:hypothetical protein WMY93_023019 [Mugilogobius chulae]|uniref:Solute carrier family 23 member 2 n=1 Tax=Mugilogobius chulae TaxID=88201 RepID=A0AAW0N484_9GOBI
MEGRGGGDKRTDGCNSRKSAAYEPGFHGYEPKNILHSDLTTSQLKKPNVSALLQGSSTKTTLPECPVVPAAPTQDSLTSHSVWAAVGVELDWIYLYIFTTAQTPAHYILAFGGIIAVPLILAEPLCIKDNNVAKSQLISTIFFVSGLATLLQTAVGTRLPILQGGTFSFITPTLAILALPKWQCPDQKPSALTNGTAAQHLHDDEVWMSRMREIQGAILVSSLLQIFLGLSGLVGFVLKYIGPLAIAPTINLIGLSLFIEAGKKSGGHWGIAALTVCLILLFSQYLSKVDVPMITYKDKKWKVFQYPLFKLFSALFGMCGGWLLCFLLTFFEVLPSKPEQYGYSARTDISLDAVTNSPWFHVPYPGRQSFGPAGDRNPHDRLGIFGKFGAVFITIPDPVIGGMFLVMFGMIAAVGISNLQSRNVLIFGNTPRTPLRNSAHPGRSPPSRLVQPPVSHSSTPATLDTGTDKERGIKKWRDSVGLEDSEDHSDLSCYDIPFTETVLKRFSFLQLLPFLPSYKHRP